MKFMLLTLAAVALFLGGIGAECPASHEVLPTLYDDDTFNCAVRWRGEGDESPLNSCVDCDGYDGIDSENVYYDGQNLGDDDEPGYFSFGSFLVKPGCTLTFWEETRFEGDFRDFYDGLEPNNDWGYYWSDPPTEGCANYGIGSFKCRCQQKMLDCVPEDGWSTILICDNTDGIVDTECEYQLTQGTTWSESTSNSFSIDVGVEYAISAGLFGLFSNELCVSGETGYDWTGVSETTTSKAETFTVKGTAPAGYTLKIEQAIGHCGSGANTEQPNTEMFKTSTLNKLGEVVSVRTEKVDVANDLDHWKNWNPHTESEPERTGEVDYTRCGDGDREQRGRETRDAVRARLYKAKGNETKNSP